MTSYLWEDKAMNMLGKVGKIVAIVVGAMVLALAGVVCWGYVRKCKLDSCVDGETSTGDGYTGSTSV